MKTQIIFQNHNRVLLATLTDSINKDTEPVETFTVTDVNDDVFHKPINNRAQAQ